MTPTDTMMPVTPASVSVEPATRRQVRREREEQHAGEREPADDDEAEQPVEEDHVERDEREADEAGDDAGVQLVLAERRRHALDRLLVLVELHRQRAVPQHRARGRSPRPG